jgi:ubiquinone/menaquinone biosynthesis C-methylase UbiE
MTYEQTVSDHYNHGDLINAIEAALPALGKDTQSVTIQDLAAVDEFHIGSRLATDHLLEQLNFSDQDHILDVGCGLGGAARYVASKYQNQVSGIDLNTEFVETGKALCRWLNLASHVSLEQGSALTMPYTEKQFDGAYMLHVGMNIADKLALFNEVNRVLKPGAYFGVYDIMQCSDGVMAYPVPWAATEQTSKLATSEQYQAALKSAGFKVFAVENRRDFALDFFKQRALENKENGGPPPLGLHTLMQQSTALKIPNMVANISNNLITPVEIIAVKKKR